MKKTLAIFLALVAWFAVITQYVLMMENRITTILESTIRFFSFFTILTNTLVAIYFTFISLKKRSITIKLFDYPGCLTAITVYIFMVGLVYQVVLRKLWNPAGLQMIIDELLHTLIPLLVILYWGFYENKTLLKWRYIPWWLIYPLVYLIYIMLRGHFSGFYPYPFINLSELDISKVLTNILILILIFVVFSVLFTGIGKYVSNKIKT
ncbi:MAG: Pr6Pr family membrane protein [Flavobacteriaceae bacterium]|nr:Pr6Pr family membrane protein [Flavobacteriaceae bacterium]